MCENCILWFAFCLRVCWLYIINYWCLWQKNVDFISDDCDGFLETDDPLDAERWEMSWAEFYKIKKLFFFSSVNVTFFMIYPVAVCSSGLCHFGLLSMKVNSSFEMTIAGFDCIHLALQLFDFCNVCYVFADFCCYAD